MEWLLLYISVLKGHIIVIGNLELVSLAFRKRKVKYSVPFKNRHILHICTFITFICIVYLHLLV